MSDRRPRFHTRTLVIAALFTAFPVADALEAASLTPTRSGLLRQASAARQHDYTHLESSADVRRFVTKGYLVAVPGNRDYVVLPSVRHKVARPEVKLFLERLGDQYRGACGQALVVTSLTRARHEQPSNSHPLSVHPTGMAMDLRVPASARCRSWLESALLGLERSGVLEAARERRPPHYHVVLFPRPYVTYLAQRKGVEVPQGERVAAAEAATLEYRVRKGDNLWTIARRHDTTVATLRSANGLRSTALKPGQVLAIPAR